MMATVLIKQMTLSSMCYWYFASLVSIYVLGSLIHLKPSNAECFTYLAASTIPGSGFGMFAGSKSYREGERVAQSDVVVPMIDIQWNNGGNEFPFLWRDYVWDCDTFPGMELDSHDYEDGISAASPGLGSVMNSHLSLTNVLGDETTQDQAGLLSDSPGIGAFSPYYGRSFYATDDIPPGMELFADYGYNYFRKRPKVYGPVPFDDNYIQADELIKKFMKLKETLSPLHSDDLWAIMIDLKENIFSRTLAALPSTIAEINLILEAGGTALQHFNRSIRSLEWLEEHGQCMDNIKPGISAVPHAGRGAFANRFIPEGSLVAPAPLIHVPDDSVFLMHEDYYNKIKKDVMPNKNKPFHKQLMLNYCFGHDESTLLLCPYGLLTNLINHGGKEANTKMVWSNVASHPEWIEQPVHQWGYINSAGLIFDFVALRDIQEDEEILINYGELWEVAWEEHVAENFSDGPPREHYLPASERNLQVHLPVRTDDERPYMLDYVIPTVPQEFLRWSGAKHDHDETVCKVLDRNDENDTYTIQLIEPDDDGEQCIIDRWDGKAEIIFEFPRAGIHFIDAKPGTRDHVQSWAFRHAMMIPDEIFPEIWKNKQQREEQ